MSPLRHLSLPLLVGLGACHGEHGSKDDTDPDAGDTEPTSGGTLRVQTLVDGVQANAPLVAVQDGDGPWTAVQGGGGLVEATLDGDRYGVAVVCVDAGGRVDVSIRHATLGESDTQVARCTVQLETVHLSGTVSGLAAGQFAWITADRSGSSATTVDPTYDFLVPEGTRDVVAVAYDATNTPLAVQVVRGLGVPYDVTRDFDLATGSTVPASHGLSVDGDGPTDTVFTQVALHTNLGTVALLSSDVATWASLPDAALVGHDVHEVKATVRDDVARTFRSSSAWVREGRDVSLTLPPLTAPPLVGVEGATPYVRPTVVQDAPGEADLIELQVSQSADVVRSWIVALSPAWRAGADVDWTTPDLSSVEGFDPAWGFVAGAELSWAVRARSSSGGYPLEDLVGSGALGGPPSPDLVGTVTDEVTRVGELVP
jgi:hypothetical protein